MPNTKRKLVTIRTVDEKKSIPKADRLEAVRVDGWWVVTSKGQFEIGDKGLFFEIDSVVPNLPQFKFLIDKSGKEYLKGLGARIKTVRLRGQLSQGLLMPLSDFPDINFPENYGGIDLSDQLGVYKYDPPECTGYLAGISVGAWPYWLPKTDQERVQNLDWNDVWNEKGERTFAVEEKLDGTSMSVWIDQDGVLGVGSRNVSFKLDDPANEENMYIVAAKKSGLLKWLEEEFKRNPGFPVAIQGELLGPKIQGNKYRLAENEFRVFDIYTKSHGKIAPGLRYEFLNMLIEYGLPLKSVPYCGVYTFSSASLKQDRVEECLKLADGNSIIHQNLIREGLVLKAIDDGNVSFKVINNNFLLLSE